MIRLPRRHQFMAFDGVIPFLVKVLAIDIKIFLPQEELSHS